MSTLDVRFRELAKRLLDTKGSSATLIVYSAGGYDPAAGKATKTGTSYPVKMSPPDTPMSTRLTLAAAENSTRRSGSFETIIAAEGLIAVPEPNLSALVFDGNTYTIAAVVPLPALDQMAAYILGCLR